MNTQSSPQFFRWAGLAGSILWLLTLIAEYSLGLQPPAGEGPLYVINQLLAFLALIGVALGYLGIRTAGGVKGKLGGVGVWMAAIGYFLIVLAGIFALVLRSDDSPIFLLFPLGGLLMDLGVLLAGIAVVQTAKWSGWRRFMPLIYAAYLWLAIEIPFIMEVFPDGPGFALEAVQALGLIGVGLATWLESGLRE
jgi:hypothetical protein